jgi:alkanesulfonate monooxygenase SsuD/methylene tetrahydromethanopterin reductase-like flavin-dependent oxidoreductase (luciferase family)
MTDADDDTGESEGAERAEADPEDPLAAAGVDPVVPDDAGDAEFPADDEVREFLRDVAEDVRGDSSESKQLSAVLYRVSDLYDAGEETSPEEIYLNVRHIMRIKSEGGLRR